MAEPWWEGPGGMELWFPKWAQNGRVRAACFGRSGGVSEKPWDSLNTGFHVEDDPARVTVNRMRCTRVLGGNLEDWVMAQQVHGQQVVRVTAKDRGRGAFTAADSVPGADGLVTNIPGLTLGILAADCVPVLFYDSHRAAVGVAHSGWKGTVGHVVREVVSVMKQSFDTRPSDLNVYLGPSIRQCCYEIGSGVADVVSEEFGSSVLIPSGRIVGTPEHFLLSLQACIRSDLMDCGVPEEQIEDVGQCTACHPNHFFSYRRSSGRTGRLVSVIRLVRED